MSPQVQRLFEAAASLPKDLRANYLKVQTGDKAVRREVLSLLAHDALAQSFFADALESAASSAGLELDLTPGTRIGAYAIARMLGHGGMGAVYLATRADGAFEQTVAIKVILASNPGSFLRERFQHERQILARLSHANIARLLDGGETPAGLPYFVLEYISGESIDLYCERRGLDLRARLSLFLQACGAVQYAHEHLVVHRDLKPGNILVGEDGNLKLLDFGIAKVLEPTHSGAPSSTRVLTPEYASPEQVRGDPITTAADIYSLGAVLYCLLTGGPPHAVLSLSPLEAARTISEEPAPAASGVPSDVGAILAKALHIDAARRYRSASEMGSDILRFLDGKPVAAVPDSLGYRAGKFLHRHWMPVLAMVAVLLALSGGAATTMWQARRADRRFDEVRHLSNRFLFEFEGAIHNVAGATKARQLLVKTAQEYLDRLAADAGHDRELIRELAEAYKKLGDVEGSTVESNTGDTKVALASYRRALALRNSIGDRRSREIKVRIGYLYTLTGLARLEQQAGDAARAIPLSQEATAASEEWMSGAAGNADFLTAASDAYTVLARGKSEKGDYRGAVASSKKSLALKQKVVDLSPGDIQRSRIAAKGYFTVGAFEKASGHAVEAVANFSTAANVLRQVAESSPADSTVRRELLTASWQLAASTLDVLQSQKKDIGPVLPLFERVSQSGKQLLQDDPANALVQADMAGISLALGSTLQLAGRPGDALAVLLPVIESQKRRLGESPDNRTTAYSLALLYTWAAESNRDQHHLRLALSERRAAGDLLGRLVSVSPSIYKYQHQKAENLQKTGDILASLGDYAKARDCYAKGLEIAEKLPSAHSLLDAGELMAQLRASSRRLPSPKNNSAPLR